MARKLDLPPVPTALEDVALIDAPHIAAAGGLSLSQWHDLVRRKVAPQPAIRGTRFTRWRLSEVRAWLATMAAESGRNEPLASGARRVSVDALPTKASSRAHASQTPQGASGNRVAP